jgi:hypothetical protein
VNPNDKAHRGNGLSGRRGYLLKDSVENILVEAIRRVPRGQTFFDPGIVDDVPEPRRAPRTGRSEAPAADRGGARDPAGAWRKKAIWGTLPVNEQAEARVPAVSRAKVRSGP